MNNTTRPVELVVFDIAGTTVKDNGEIALAFQTALRDFGYQVPVSKINPLMGYRKTEAIKRMLLEYEKEKDKITTEYIESIHDQFLKSMIDYYTNAAEIIPLPNVEEVFSGLKDRNIRIALDTGFSKEITDVIMARLQWIKDKKVDFVVSSSEVKEGRPFPYMIEEIMRNTGVTDPKKVVKVGDTEVDVFEGKNAACLYSIAVTTGAFTREELAPYNPSFIIDDIKELLSIIDNIQ